MWQRKREREYERGRENIMYLSCLFSSQRGMRHDREERIMGREKREDMYEREL
jgi:hypothetical protein